MKKRIFSLLVLLALLLSCALPVAAEATTAKGSPSYYEIGIPIVDVDNLYYCTVMIPYDESCVYIKAEDIPLLLNCGGLDYEYNQTHQQCAIVSDSMDFAAMFKFDSTDVCVYAAGSTLYYDAPAASLYEKGVTWLPFEFTMKLLNMSVQAIEDKIVAESAYPSALMIISALYSSEDLSFDWQNELGYSTFGLLLKSGSAHMVNALSGLLSREGHVWLDLITLSLGNFTEAKYSSDISNLFTTPSQDELISLESTTPYIVQDALKTTTEAAGVISKGAKFEISSIDDMIDVYDDLFKAFPSFKNDESMKSFYNSLKSNKRILKKADSLLESISNKADAVDDILITMDVISYVLAFENKSATAADALELYANSSEEIDWSSKKTLLDYARNAKSSEPADALERFFRENIDDIIIDKLPISELIGGPASAALLAWDLMSNHLPYFKNGLESTDQFELSEYAINFQNDVRLLMNDQKTATFTASSVNSGEMEELIQLTYSYLKFSYIARNTACAIVNLAPNISESSKISTINTMEAKNKIIGKYLATLDAGIVGYLPKDVKKSSSAWNTEGMISAIKASGERLSDPVVQKLVPLDELCRFPGDDSMITEEEAVELVKKTMGRSMADYIFDEMLTDVYTFSVADGVYFVQEKNIHAYVISMAVAGQTDAYCFFVPIDGSEVWMGWLNPDGTYFCYSDVDLLHFSFTKLFTSIGEMYGDLLKEELLTTAPPEADAPAAESAIPPEASGSY